MQHRPQTAQRREPRGYLEHSRRPLHILVFLLPLIAFYEIGSTMYLADAAQGTIETIRAHSILLGFFQEFGVVGRFLPGIALITVLLAGHFIVRDRWTIRPLVLGGMAIECIVWTIPLIVLIALVQVAGGSAAGGGTGDVGLGVLPGAAALQSTIAEMPVGARLTISIGAGLYEELLFRMIGIAAIHLVLVDLFRINDRYGSIIAVLLSAVAFALYHDITTASGHTNLLTATALMLAGVYFGVVFLSRGLAIVVGVHALYDIFVLVILRQG